jgi:hypothetical protein
VSRLVGSEMCIRDRFLDLVFSTQFRRPVYKSGKTVDSNGNRTKRFVK